MNFTRDYSGNKNHNYGICQDKDVSIGVLNTLKHSPNDLEKRGYIRFTCVPYKVMSIFNEVKQIEGAKVILVRVDKLESKLPCSKLNIVCLAKLSHIKQKVKDHP